MNEYRCTRDYPYQGNCPGNTNPKTRQGYYITAYCPRVALSIMAERFPQDVAFGYWFTCDLWKENVRTEAERVYV